ncbi:universal stress protein [Halegenticoccus tardaugens]|uniref:universal stress protein n=1 Tax=Halegenticoccus tardaugens TaxID=2071624 RepID=UPI0013E949B3|nr:universal stress protein [Halegenticoccus tardaugens]
MTRKRVLVAVSEEEERAGIQAELVSDFFDPENVEVVVHHNFTDNPEGATVGQVAAVRRAEERLDEEGFDVSLCETSGKSSSTAILDAAADRDADLICIFARRRSPTGKVLFGSVAQDVILSSSRPILIAPQAGFGNG